MKKLTIIFATTTLLCYWVSPFRIVAQSTKSDGSAKNTIAFDTTILFNCPCLTKFDQMGPEKVNMSVTYSQLIKCAPILANYINKNSEIRLRVHGFVFNKLEYFKIDFWEKSPLKDTLYEICVIRTQSTFDNVFMSSHHVINHKNEYIMLGELLAAYDSSETSFMFIKSKFLPFNLTQWEKEKRIKFHQNVIKNQITNDTLFKVYK